ncbi:MAG TPA: threonine/serine dehydratase [Steroidobacter sp.]|jgi:threonine dehydratase|nr:threonine/serine dehydratase [Steroidobacter sp.]
MSELSPGPEEVVAAAERLAGRAVLTPLLQSQQLNERVGGVVLLKAENLQIGGAFKFRGAFNRLVQLTPAERSHGVVAWSSGNHAQGVAAAAQLLGVRAAIVMPQDAPKIKIDNTRRLGAQIVFYDRQHESRETIAKRLAAETGAALVPSYDDPHVIAGQGVLALEIAEQAQRMYGRSVDVLLAPCSGGGLVAGCALAMRHVSPNTRIYSVEPAMFDDTARSLTSGKRESAPTGAVSACDALQAPTPGELTFPVNRRLLAGGLTATDETVFEAMRFAWRELKLVLEPSGAIALGALLAGALDVRGRTIAVVLSGGNVDADLYCKVLARSPEVNGSSGPAL